MARLMLAFRAVKRNRRSTKFVQAASPRPKPAGMLKEKRRATPPFRAVLLDDDPRLHETVEKITATHRKFWSLELCADYSSLLPAIASHPPAALLVAASIGGMSGIDTLRKLRLAFPALPVILLADSAKPSTVIEAVRAGARGFLVKPLTTRAL